MEEQKIEGTAQATTPENFSDFFKDLKTTFHRGETVIELPSKPEEVKTEEKTEESKVESEIVHDPIKDTQRAYHIGQEQIALLKAEREESKRTMESLISQNQELIKQMQNFAPKKELSYEEQEQQKYIDNINQVVDSAIQKRLSHYAPVMDDISRRVEFEKYALANPKEIEQLGPHLLQVKRAWDKIPNYKWTPEQLINAAKEEFQLASANRTSVESAPQIKTTTASRTESQEELRKRVDKLTTETGISKGEINAADLPVDTSSPSKAFKSAFAKAAAQLAEGKR